MNFDNIKSFLDRESGKELKNYLINELNKLKDIDNVKDFSKAQDQAIELKSQKKAYEKLRDILEDIMTIEGLIEEKEEKEYGL